MDGGNGTVALHPCWTASFHPGRCLPVVSGIIGPPRSQSEGGRIPDLYLPPGASQTVPVTH